jgi:hypothetical protein
MYVAQPKSATYNEFVAKPKETKVKFRSSHIFLVLIALASNAAFAQYAGQCPTDVHLGSVETVPYQAPPGAAIECRMEIDGLEVRGSGMDICAAYAEDNAVVNCQNNFIVPSKCELRRNLGSMHCRVVRE